MDQSKLKTVLSQQYRKITTAGFMENQKFAHLTLRFMIHKSNDELSKKQIFSMLNMAQPSYFSEID